MSGYTFLPSVERIAWAYREVMAELDRKQAHTCMAARLVRNDTELVFVGYRNIADAVSVEVEHYHKTGCWWCIARRGEGIVAQGVVVADYDGATVNERRNDAAQKAVDDAAAELRGLWDGAR